MLNTPLGFGGLARTVDERDFNLGSYQPPTIIPPVFKQFVGNIPVQNQGKYPTCAAHAGAFFNSKLQSDKYKITKSLSPKYLWDQIKQIDGFSIYDGTDMRSIFRSLVNTGTCDITLLPNSLGASIIDYSNIRNISDAMRYNGYQHDLTNYAFIDMPTFAQIKQAIFLNKAVLALVDIGDGWWLPNWSHILPVSLGNAVGHHFVTLHGYDETRIYFRNSWSDAWGINGDGYFDASYIPHVLEIGTALTLPAPYIFTTDMQHGDSNNSVLQLQRRLNVNPQSAWFGPITTAAVIKYQLSHGLPGTGYCGPLTRQKLNTSVDDSFLATMVDTTIVV